MPTPKAGESQDEYISRCIPMVMHEGTAKNSSQAAAICHSMWDEHKKEKSMDEKSLNDMEQAEKELEARMRKAFSTEDPGLFTACMDDPDNKKRYPDEERRARVCASVHKKITGIYPAEHESKELKEVIAESAATKDATNAAEHLRLAIELHQAHLDGSEPTDEESQEALMVHLRAALDELGEEVGESEKGEEHPWHRGRPGEIGGSTSSGAGGAVGEGGTGAYRGGDREEWRMVNRRLAAGGLKRGERALLERRAEKLAMRILGVKEKKSLKSLILDTVISLFGVPKAKEESRSAFDAGAVGAVFKQADGRWRWVSFSSNSFEDGDREIISQKALEDDVRHSDATKEYGPLLWWHVPGAELGVCDFRAMHGKMLVESGTFHLAAVGEKMAKAASSLKTSLGFFHPLTEPDDDGVFNVVRTFERSPLPAISAANKLTALPVITRKESSMDAKKLEALQELLGDDLAAQVVQKADEQTKAAQDAGVRFKEAEVKQDEPPAEEPAAEEAPGELADDAPVTIGMLKEVIAGLRAEMQQMHEEMGAPMAEEAKAHKEKSEALESRLTAAETEIKRLTGGLPRAVKTGFRASAADETIVSEEKTKEINPPPDPFVEFTNAVVLGKRP